MPDTRQDQHVEPDQLGEQIDGLLDEMEAAADDVARELMGEAPSTGVEPTAVPPADPVPEPIDDNPTEPIDDSVPEPVVNTDDEIADDPSPEEPAETVDDAHVDAPDSGDAAVLDEQVGKLVDEAIETAEHPSHPPTIDSLDDELAALAEDLLTDDSELIDGSITASTDALEREPDQEPAPTLDPESVTETPPRPEDVEPTEAPSEQLTEEPPAPETKATPEPKAASAKEPVAEPKPARKSKAKGSTGTRVLSVSIATVELAGRPLANKSSSVRQTVGWAALVTMFNASIIWGYMLFVREPSKPATNNSAPTLVVPKESTTNAIPD